MRRSSTRHGAGEQFDAVVGGAEPGIDKLGVGEPGTGGQQAISHPAGRALAVAESEREVADREDLGGPAQVADQVTVGAVGTSQGEQEAPEPEPSLRSVVILGTGLIGTSIGLALRARGVDVALDDIDITRVSLASSLGAGRVRRPDERFDLAIAAVPPAEVPKVLMHAYRLDLAQTYTDVCGVKAGPLRDLESLGMNMTKVVGGHPMAGRERSGPTAARRDLFDGRPWVVVPSSASAPDAVERVRLLARACRGVVIEMGAEEHDEAAALVSHLGHIVSTLLAGQLEHADQSSVDLAGPGVRDMTRLAAGDPALWADLLSANAAHVAVALRNFGRDVDAMVAALDEVSAGSDAGQAALRDLLVSGVRGRDRLPGKHGRQPVGWTTVVVVVPDSPGELARLLHAAGEAEVNVEDVALDHEPGRMAGLVELSVRPDVADKLVTTLRSQGWSAHV